MNSRLSALCLATLGVSCVFVAPEVAHASERLTSQEGRLDTALALGGNKSIYYGYVGDRETDLYLSVGKQHKLVSTINYGKLDYQLGSNHTVISDDRESYIIDNSTGTVLDRDLEETRSDMRKSLYKSLKETDAYDLSNAEDISSFEFITGNTFSDILCEYKLQNNDGTTHLGVASKDKYLDLGYIAGIYVYDENRNKNVKLEEYNTNYNGLSCNLKSSKIMYQNDKVLYLLSVISVTKEDGSSKDYTYIQVVDKSQTKEIKGVCVPKSVTSYLVGGDVSKNEGSQDSIDSDDSSKDTVGDSVISDVIHDSNIDDEEDFNNLEYIVHHKNELLDKSEEISNDKKNILSEFKVISSNQDDFSSNLESVTNNSDELIKYLNADSTKFTLIGKDLIGYDIKDNMLSVTSIKLNRKSSIYSVETSKLLTQSVNSKDSVCIDSNSNLWCISGSKIMSLKGEKLSEVYLCGRGMEGISVFDTANVIVWSPKDSYATSWDLDKNKDNGVTDKNDKYDYKDKDEDDEEDKTVSDKVQSIVDTVVDSKVGWFTDRGVLKYREANGVIATNKWVKDEKGYSVHVDAKGVVEKDKFIKDSGKFYYVDEEGHTINGWVDYNDKWYYMDSSGAMITGWYHDLDGSWYYFKTDGTMTSYATVDGYKIGVDGRWVH